MSETSILSPQGKPSIFKSWSVEWLAYSGEWALPNMDKVSEMRQSLILAGYRHPKAPAVYFGFRIVTAFVLTFSLILYFVIRESAAPINFLMAFCIGLAGFHLPASLLRIKMKNRQERLDKALPDILDMFVISMDAGLSLNAALHRVAEETRGVFQEFYEELQITAAEIRTGITWDEAFDNLAKRTGVQSIRSMVGLMIQSSKLGGSVGDALRHHGEFTRTQRLLRAEEKAAKLPVKMVIPMIFCIFPAIIIVVVGPGLIHIFDTFIKNGLFSGGFKF
ncbi:MAG: type II secretion system F family protein [Deltaproteobacteria bacterium]|nr:type II secretion system F family protein [Deltaproteobacteria bacterium]